MKRIYSKNTTYAINNLIYQNYHKHSIYTNPIMMDSCAYPEDYAKRAVELNHGIISSVEHGYQGRYIESYEMAQQYNLKYLFGVEAYFVYDRFEKDNTNAHICLLAKNESGRKAINRILSEANLTGFYYRARIDYDLLMSLPENDVWITSACISGINRYTKDNGKSEKLLEVWDKSKTIYNSPYELLVDKIHQKFGDNFYLEVQAHNTDLQRQANAEMIKLSSKYNIEIIAGVDSHYIYENDAWKRDYLQKSSGIFLEDEQGWYMDYPDGKTLFNRFKRQGTLQDDEILIAIDNTNVFLNVQEYTSSIFNHEMKMPSAPKYQKMSQEEKQMTLMKIVRERWDEVKKDIPVEQHAHYMREIAKELDIIFKINHADYFLLNYEIIKDAVENRGGMITFSGRGSGPSFYVNHLLGFTQIDRISSPITLYPERFLSTSRMSAGSLADIDFNCGNTPVFEDAQRFIMGEEHAYPMIAYGTMKPKAAWKMYCRAVDVDFETSNAISSKIDEYETDLKYWDEESGEEEPNVYDYIPDDLRETFDGSKEFLGLTIQASRHPCFVGDTLVNTDKGYMFIKDINVGDKVMSHDGQYHTVLETMVNKSDDLYELKTGACEKIVGTGNHPFYVISKYKERVKNTKGHMFNKVMYGNPYWKNLSELTKDDLICIPINNNSIIPTFKGLSDSLMKNKNFWWFVGRFVGDGWVEECLRENNRIEKRIKLCCSNINNIEKDEIETRIKDILQYRIEKHRTVYKFIIANDCNFALCKFLQQFGKYAKYKFIPNFIIDLPVDLLKEFLDGYFSADGYLEKKDFIVFSTISEKLYYSLSECIMKVYKTPARIGIRKAQKYIIEGRIVNGEKQFSGRFFTYTNKEYLRKSIYKNGCLWVNVKSVTRLCDEQNVYNLSVNETNTYNVYNHIVHNCGNILLTQNIKEEVGIVRLKSKGGRETICACLDGKWCEKYLMLKNDLLTVACVKLNYLLYDRIGLPYMSLNKLLEECKEHPEVWNMYEKGYVIGLNQVEKPSTQRKVMKYKPKNISELSAFIAGIRPAFKSLLDKLINREHFEYGIPTLDKLLQTEELPESFILYQEQIMKILAFAGIPMGDCYTVIKSISKKRFEKIMHYKEQFMIGMETKLIEEEGISKEKAEETTKTIWGIIEDASAYGFNSSHSLSVSFDSLLAAYFKALYPYEFYEVYLNLQMERADKAKALLAKKEMKEAFGISVLPMRFRQDNRSFVALPEKKALSNCLKSIKGFGNKIGEEFFKIKDIPYNDFIDFLIDVDAMKNNKEGSDTYNPDKISGFAVNGTQIETLIMLNYFEEFGCNYKLLKTKQIYDLFASRKTINKNKIDLEQGYIIIEKEKHKIDADVFKKYIGKETKSMYKDLNMIGYIREVSDKIPNKSVDLLEQLKFERELLEFPIYQNEELPQGWYYVLGFKTYGDKVSTPYLVLYSLVNGDLVVCSINKSKLFRDNPFGIYSIINVKNFQDVVKKKKVGEKKFIPTNETKKVVADYEVILRNEKEELQVLEQQEAERKGKKEG